MAKFPKLGTSTPTRRHRTRNSGRPEACTGEADVGLAGVSQPGSKGSKHWLYALVPDWVIPHVVIPRGGLGWLSGQMMALINREMNRTLVALLELQGHEEVLEIGSGPGVAAEMIAEQLTTGHLTGIDPSSLMIKLAHRRNRAAARSGTVDFQIGKANHLPGGNAAYDAVCSANSVQLWESLEEGIAEIRRVLRPRGRVVIAVHEWVGDDLPVSVPARLRSHGFESVRVHRTRDTSGLTLNFLAHAASR